jgi:hypothetical protein
MLVPILRSQSEIHSELEGFIEDTANERWTDAQYVRALNMALSTWQGRVMVPYLYSISGGWNSTTYDFSLPDYVTGPIDPQILRTYDWPDNLTITTDLSTWVDMEGYSLEANGTGGQTLRLHWPPYASDGRIKWWGHNGPVPVTAPVTSAQISASDTSVTLTTKPVIGRSGYIKIDSEWMQYAGVTEGATTLTLSNLVRGVQGTTAAVHIIGSSVVWGVAMDRGELLNQLYDQCRMFLWEMKIANPGSAQADHINKLVRLYEERSYRFWARYTSQRPPKFRVMRMF